MSFDYTSTDEQTQPQASNVMGGGSSFEASKNLISIVLGNADPFINHRQQGGVSITIRADMYRLSVSEFNGVGK